MLDIAADEAITAVGDRFLPVRPMSTKSREGDSSGKSDSLYTVQYTDIRGSQL